MGVMSIFSRLVVPVIVLGAGVALVALPGGCKRTSPPGNATVRGTVLFQGQPLAGGLIIFSPDQERGGSGKPARGEIGPDGRYQLTLVGSTSVPPGWYRVAIVALPVTTSRLDQPVFPAKLARPDMSGLSREVQPGCENTFDFAVDVPVG
jgi:hypothetical protein